jgi:drug/metabolite transporter (DMT)-like permease
METAAPPRAWKVWLAFAIIYLVWGSTFFAIRVGVREVPPFLLAALRFLVAGIVLYAWARSRGIPSPTAAEWRGAMMLAVLIFVGDYGGVFWAERRVPSGIAAVMLATIPSFMALSEILIMKTQRLTGRLALALLLGIGGVGVLVSRSAALGDAAIDAVGACVLLLASLSWSIASALSRKLPSPPVKTMSSAAQMCAGGILLTIVAASLGEFREFHPQAVSAKAWFALVYLIVAGSIVGFTAYVWLLHHESPTKVGTYAYVNPIVAVLVGYFLGGEPIGVRTIAGTMLVLVSVVIITTTPKASKRTEFVAQEAESA